MEVLTEAPSGTKLRIDNDRDFEGQAGDGVLRVHGEREGRQVFDSAYVEVDEKSAEMIATALRELRRPSPELQEKVAQEIQATFGSKLGGRDAHQVAEIALRCFWQTTTEWAGVPQTEATGLWEKLIERFTRAASKKRQPYSGAATAASQN